MIAPLVIIGPTASGKSALAVALAQRQRAAGRDAEIISSDAMAVYIGMDIGTAKPSIAEQGGIPHHLIDVVPASHDFTVAEFARRVHECIDDLDRRGVIPIIVGGTGLYVRAVVDTFTIPPQFDEIRAELEAEADTEGLWQRLQLLDPAAAAKMLPSNRRRIIRALEVTLGSGQPFSSFGPGVDTYGPTRFAQAGLEIGREVLDDRINARYEAQIRAGFVDEVRAVMAAGWSATAAQALGYREIAAYLQSHDPQADGSSADGSSSDGYAELADAVEQAKRRTRRFARRQQRWFRRDPRIEWFDYDTPHLVDAVEQWWLHTSQTTAEPASAPRDAQSPQ